MRVEPTTTPGRGGSTMIGTGVGGIVTIGCGVYVAGFVPAGDSPGVGVAAGVFPGMGGVSGVVGCGCAGTIGALLRGVARVGGGETGGLTDCARPLTPVAKSPSIAITIKPNGAKVARRISPTRPNRPGADV